MLPKIVDKSLGIARELFFDAYSYKRNRVWHFAFAYKKNKLLAIGQNDMNCPDARSVKFFHRFNVDVKYPSRHAEIDAIDKMWGRVHIDSSIKFVVLRLNNAGNLCNSRPCNRCHEILYALGIKKIYHSTPTNDIILMEQC